MVETRRSLLIVGANIHLGTGPESQRQSFSPSSVNSVLSSLYNFLVILLRLIKDTSLLTVCIFNAQYAVSPSTFQNAISLAQELSGSFELFVITHLLC